MEGGHTDINQQSSQSGLISHEVGGGVAKGLAIQKHI